MTPTREIDMQCTHARFLEMLPRACGNRPFEIVDNVVSIHEGDRVVRITVHDEPIRHLGSLDLPMESARFEFPDHTEEEAEDFMASWHAHTQRAGGG